MNSLILRTMARYLLPLFLLFSLLLFWRGHNAPGGGFVAGLTGAIGFVLYSVAHGPTEARRALRIDPRLLIGLGLLIAVVSGLVGLVSGLPFLTGRWGYVTLPGLGRLELGTPLFFDLGVYLTVVGAALTIIFVLQETE